MNKKSFRALAGKSNQSNQGSKKSFENKERFDEKKLPENVTLASLLKPRQVIVNPDHEAKEYVEQMYSYDIVSDFAQRILDIINEKPVDVEYVRHRYTYNTGYVKDKYRGSLDRPKVDLSTADFSPKDMDEVNILNQVIGLLQKPTSPVKKVLKEPKINLAMEEVDDIFEDVGTDYVITAKRDRPNTKKVDLEESESDKEQEIVMPINFDSIKQKIQDQGQQSDSESDDDLPLLGNVPEQIDSYDYIDSGSEDEEEKKAMPKTANLDHELKKVGNVYREKYGQGLVEEGSSKKRSAESTTNKPKKRK